MPTSRDSTGPPLGVAEGLRSFASPESRPARERLRFLHRMDLRLEGVEHRTPGLEELAEAGLEPLVSGRSLDNREGGLEFGGGEGAPGAGEKILLQEQKKACQTAKFLTARRPAAWYKKQKVQHSGGGANRCTTVEHKISEKSTIPIYWAAIGRGWTTAVAKSKMDEAQTWFRDGYCIELNIHRLRLTKRMLASARKKLAQGEAAGTKAYTAALLDLYAQLWRTQIGKARQLLVVLFVDTYAGLHKETKFAAASKIGGGPFRVALNLAYFPVLAIPSDPETGSTNLVTHELVHGLGKLAQGGNPPTTHPYKLSKDVNKNNTWNHGADCPVADMGNVPQGRNPRRAFQKTGTHYLDYASYWQFTEVAKTVF